MVFTILDYVILVILFLSIILGISRGFIREILSLITWLASLFFSIKFAPDLMFLFHSITSKASVQYASAAVVIFLIVLIIGTIISRLISRSIKSVGFGFFDRLLGLIFGAARGGILVVILLLIIQSTALDNQAWAENSSLTPHFEWVLQYFDRMIPEKFAYLVHWFAYVRKI